MRAIFTLVLLIGAVSLPVSAQEKPPLKVAMLIPIEPWDRKAGLEAWRKWLEDRYRVDITWIEPAVPLPTKDTPEAERKAYYANPPAIPNLEKAFAADVVFTALTHVSVNEKQSADLLKLYTTKPLLGGRRSHHAMNLKVPKDLKVPGLDKPGEYGRIFGGTYAGHHGGTQQIKEGQENHPIVKGLPDLVKFSLHDRGYKHKIVADDVTVLIEMKDSKEPQTWCRINKQTKQRVFYTVHDPVDIEKHEAVRIMLTRALFWACERNEPEWRK